MIDLTKYTRWIPPTKSTLFKTPVIVTEFDGHTERLHAVVLERRSGCFVLENGGAFNVDSELYIPIPKPVSRRLTRGEMVDLIAMGGFVIVMESGGECSSYFDIRKNLCKPVENSIKYLRRAFTQEYLDPTTDLLPEGGK